ncbi:MAG: arylsulfotransferase family protein [Alphaproteobacteria bacterium]
MLKAIQITLAFWLVAFGLFVYGMVAQRYNLYPYPMFAPYFTYVESFAEDTTTLRQKLDNDFGGKPWRIIRTFSPADPDIYQTLEVDGLNPRRQSPRIMLKDTTPGFRMLFGAFDFVGGFWGAILIDENGKVVHTWQLSGEGTEMNSAPDTNKILYGVGIFPDGSIAYNLENANQALMKRDVCGVLQWATPGLYHHSAEPSADYKTVWTFRGRAPDAYPEIVQMDAQDGRILRTIHGYDIQKANPELYIFDLRSLEHQEFISGYMDTNYPHHNDIKPLMPKMATAFPQFRPGDLAINHRTINMFYVMDPDSLKVKFWYFGAADGGHDVDWQPDGTFSLFNNKWRAGWNANDAIEAHSSVMSIDPRTHTHTTLWDGKALDVYSIINGRHDVTPNRTVLVTSSTQGRFIEADIATGDTVFEFINDYDPTAGQTLHVSDAFWLPKDFFTTDMYQAAASCK